MIWGFRSNARLGPKATALVIVLVFVSLVSVLVVAFLQQGSDARQLAFSLGNQTLVRLLSKSALGVIIHDLRGELVSGGQTPPKMPWRCTVNPLHSNLVKQSAGGEAAYPGGPVRALADPLNSSFQPSFNGRFTDPKQWNKSYLLVRSASASPNDTTPIDFKAPDWVLITREQAGLDLQGQTLTAEKLAEMADPAASNPNKVIGRFAYMIFDEGGLLDVNAAGYPSGLSASQVSRKGLLGFADLTQVGLSIGSPNQVDRIVGWRNFASTHPGRHPGGNFYNYDFTQLNNGKTAAEAYFESAIADKLDAAGVVSGALFEGTTDQRFVGRRELLQFRRATAFSDDVLQYLGCFSRELTTPSFAPEPGRPMLVGDSLHGGNDAFDTSDRRAERINPPLPGQRVAAGGFVRNDGSVAVEGEALVARRFALTRLAWVSFEGPSADHGGDPQGTSENIRKYFGLHWDQGEKEWIYSHGGSRAIASLEEVRALGRDPDFFELLKAGILAGSLGKCAPRSNETGAYKANFIQRQRDASLERHLFRIGANMIDQADTDSFPTRLRVQGEALWGSEDLPCLYRLHLEAVRTGPQTAAAMIEPELWNPYDWRSTPCSRGPTRLRITLETEATQFDENAAGRSAPHTRETSALEFSLPLSDRGSYRHPTLVRHSEDMVPGPLNTEGLVLSAYNVCDLGKDSAFSIDQAGAASKIIGFNVGSLAEWPADKRLTASLTAVGGLKFRLEYEDAGWRPYQELYIPSDKALGLRMSWPFGSPGAETSRAAVLCDPRTDRFGVSWVTTDSYPVSAFTACAKPPITSSGTNLLHESMRPEVRADFPAQYSGEFNLVDAGRGQGWTGDFARFFTGTLCENSSSSPAYYADADGVVRRAMGGYVGGSGSRVGLPMLTPATAQEWSGRPFLLNRPFRSVAELGYVFRDSPWKNLDFFTPESGDAALLDLFCVRETQRVVSGRVNINSRHLPVLKAVLAGTAKDPWGTERLTVAEAERVARLLLEQHQRGGLGNPAELVGLTGALGPCYDDNGVLQRSRETALRALADVGSTRVWSLMIDLVAQAGHFVPGARRLDQFVVEGEKRVWVHLAIDRFTGAILDFLSEEITE